MELLLFLSALLSALTGAISGVRAPEMQVHQSCGSAVAVQAITVERTAPARAIRSWLTLADGWKSADAGIYRGVATRPALFAAIPRYLDKPRE